MLSLVNRFLSTKMNEGASVNEHINKLSVLGEELKIAGYPFQEEVQVMVVLNSLPNSWEQFKMSFCHSERTLNMRNLRHHLLMEEDRKFSQGKERNSNNSELHLGEERHNSNKRNWHKKKGKGDLRDKLTRNAIRMIVEIMTHLRGMTKLKRLFLVTTVVRLGTLDLNAGRRRNIIMIRRSRTTMMIPKVALQRKVCIMLMFALKLYLLLFFRIAGLSTPVVHHISQETVNVLLPCKQFQGEIDMST